MRKYRFALEAGLRWRRHQQEAAELQLHQSLQQQRQRERELGRWQEQQRQEEQSLAELAIREAAAEELAQHSRYGQFLRQAAERARAELEKAETRARRDQEQWLEARRRFRVLEKVRARRYAEYQRERQREEERELGEVALRTRERQQATGAVLSAGE